MPVASLPSGKLDNHQRLLIGISSVQVLAIVFFKPFVDFVGGDKSYAQLLTVGGIFQAFVIVAAGAVGAFGPSARVLRHSR